MLDVSDAVIAHNVQFDKQWFGKGHLPEIKKPWICSMEDISWSSKLNLKASPSVVDLALAHEVPVWSAHRALTDCIYIVEVFKRCKEFNFIDLEQMLVKALEPKKLVKAEVSYEERNFAKNAGFRWNDPVKGSWTRKLSERAAAKLDFSVTPIEKEESL